jgi:hypothetical protein
MRIFSKRAFRFDHPAGESEKVYVPDQQFSDVPDWVAATATFKLATKHDLINVIESKKEEKAVEKAVSTRKKSEEN